MFKSFRNSPLRVTEPVVSALYPTLSGKDLVLPRSDLGPIRSQSQCAAVGAATAAALRGRGTSWLPAIVLLAAVGLVSMSRVASAQQAPLQLPDATKNGAVVVRAGACWTWAKPDYDIWILSGGCEIAQQDRRAQAQQAVLWVHRGRYGETQNRITVYLEGNVSVEQQTPPPANAPPGAARPAPVRVTDATWYGEFESTDQIVFRTPQAGPEPAEKPMVYANALLRRRAMDYGKTKFVRPAQFAAPIDETDPLQEDGTGLIPNPNNAGTSSFQPVGVPNGMRRVRVRPRSSVPVSAKWFPSPTRDEWVAVVDSGVNIIIDGLDQFGTVDVSADRVVIFTSGVEEPDLTGQSLQNDETPMQIYLEGNIVFRQGNRIVQANRMFYDVNNEVGIVLNAEILTPVPNYRGLLRLKAEVLEQTGRDRFVARDAYLTSSRLGRPGYRMASGDIYFEDNQFPAFDLATGEPVLDPETGEQVVQHERLATSFNNFIFVGEVPVFYWPVLATNLENPQFYIDRIRFKNDQIFGTQLLVDFSPFEILGITNPPAGVDWDASVDYLSDRGLGLGTRLSYSRMNLFDIPGPYSGFVDAWGIKDHGLDNLGAGRMNLIPEKDYRGRVLGRHRQFLPNDIQLTAELGLISDRNFLEQYFENEWDEFKDLTTGIELKQTRDNRSLSLFGDVRLNEFFTQTQWLPRLDHYWIGQPLLQDTFTYFGHSQIAYANMKTASPPSPINPSEVAQFRLLPWEVNARGERIVSRHEIDFPFNVGPVKVVVHGEGELAHWGNNISGDDEQRAFGQFGVRANLPIWSVNPNIESRLFNVHGVAHKVNFELDATFADATKPISDFPLYDPLDDDSTEAFRRRFQFNTFGGTTPIQFDERYYALRSGLQNYVSSPSAEIADDLTAVRMGAHQRWQTKRGPANNRHIIDWIVLDTDIVLFPDADRDNFGENFGLATYDFRWHIGDEFTLLSSGTFDFFDQGQKIAQVGGYLTRPPRGGLYLGFRAFDGPIKSKVGIASYSYRMSPKWVSTMGTSIDFGEGNNIGQTFSLTRIGESFLASFQFTANHSKDNVGVNLLIEPRFLPTTRLGRAGGAQIPVAGLYGLE